jgi:proteic killer suppression protein
LYGDTYTKWVYAKGVAVIRRVAIGRTAEKQLRKAPPHITAKLLQWIDLVEEEGLEEARRIPGYHDEALHGTRRGQRSIRLSRSWRAIYVLMVWGHREVVRVEEVHKHEY